LIENAFYKISQDFIALINNLGGIYKDNKERPIFCCFEDKYIKNLFWAIPTSYYSHRSPKQLQKINGYCSLDQRDIRYSYYHIGHTNKKAMYRISNCFPITDKYIDAPYMSQGLHLILASKHEIKIIRQKLSRILLDEKKHPNKYEQHITDIRSHLIREMEK